MPIMAKSNDEYAEVKAIKTPDGTEIDYVLSKVDNTYKRTYTATRELEDTPPLEFKSIKPNANLTDYRIYGNTQNGEAVGDLVTSGEHAGEYKVPVTVEGKNLVPNTATSQTINGVTFTVNSDGSVTYNGTATQTAVYTLNDTFSLEPGTYNLKGCPAGGGYIDKYKLDVVAPPTVYGTDIGNGSSFTLSSTLTNALYRIIIYAGQTCNNLTFYPMIRLATIEDDTYEPYRTPVTTPIYLPEQIRKVGDYSDYIDYGSQKFVHRVVKKVFDGTETFKAASDYIDFYSQLVSASSPDSINVACNYFICLSANDGYRNRKTPNAMYVTVHYSSGRTVMRFYFNDSSGTSKGETAFKSQLADWYANGAPLIVDYIIVEPVEEQVTLPALPMVTGTNVLSVGTEVQPSDMYIKGNFKMIAGGGE